jgi:hypothetical protein
LRPAARSRSHRLVCCHTLAAARADIQRPTPGRRAAPESEMRHRVTVT